MADTPDVSRRDVVCVLFVFLILWPLKYPCGPSHPLGFLPVAIAWLRMKHKSAPVQLPDSEDLPLKPAAQQLRGWKILLLWLPAACDLTGTTVCWLLLYSEALT
jgi:hypothetical protein